MADDIVKKTEEACSDYAKMNWPGHTPTKTAIMSACLTAGGVEQYKDNIRKANGHGLPPAAAKPASAPAKGK